MVLKSLIRYQRSKKERAFHLEGPFFLGKSEKLLNNQF